MSEYIVTTEQLNWFLERMDETVAIPAAIAHLRPIVRCRDCGKRRDWTEEEESASYGEAELADGWCTFLRIGTYDDFFCAWGKNEGNI